MDRRNAILRAGLIAGAAVLAPTYLTILQSCKQEPRLDWKPEFFTNEEAETISALLDTILPKTDTPGALDVKADLFIDKVVARTYDAAGQEDMRKNIAEFNEKSKSEFGKPFAGLKEEDKIAFLKKEEANSPKFNGKVWGTAVGKQEPVGFYRSMKSMAIWAFTSSEEIGKNVLSYDPIPGEYKGCIPLSEVGNAWSL